jgi:hypothetical protein
MYFGNKSLVIHILRGILGIAALYVSLATIGQTLWPSLILIPAALFFLKGCPMCWTMGLIETIAMRVRKMRKPRDCVTCK